MTDALPLSAFHTHGLEFWITRLFILESIARRSLFNDVGKVPSPFSIFENRLFLNSDETNDI